LREKQSIRQLWPHHSGTSYLVGRTMEQFGFRERIREWTSAEVKAAISVTGPSEPRAVKKFEFENTVQTGREALIISSQT
jgi:hypothetical protein